MALASAALSVPEVVSVIVRAGLGVVGMTLTPPTVILLMLTADGAAQLGKPAVPQLISDLILMMPPALDVVVPVHLAKV